MGKKLNGSKYFPVYSNLMGFYIHFMNYQCFVPVFMDFIQQGFQPALSTLTVSVQESDHLPSSLFGTWKTKSKITIKPLQDTLLRVLLTVFFLCTWGTVALWHVNPNFLIELQICSKSNTMYWMPICLIVGLSFPSTTHSSYWSLSNSALNSLSLLGFCCFNLKSGVQSH